ncbi:hypothetical protein WA026_016336, partial [Henosepilachna vigintioctopunctata]
IMPYCNSMKSAANSQALNTRPVVTTSPVTLRTLGQLSIRLSQKGNSGAKRGFDGRKNMIAIAFDRKQRDEKPAKVQLCVAISRKKCGSDFP